MVQMNFALAGATGIQGEIKGDTGAASILAGPFGATGLKR
jgi:hypothetical protein